MRTQKNWSNICLEDKEHETELSFNSYKDNKYSIVQICDEDDTNYNFVHITEKQAIDLINHLVEAYDVNIQSIKVLFGK